MPLQLHATQRKATYFFIAEILSRVVFPAVCIREAHGLLDKPFSTGKSAVLREPAEPSISNVSRDAANLTPVNSGFPTPTKLFFALGAFCAGCCSRQLVHKRLLPEAHHEEVATCALLGLLTLSGGLCLPVQQAFRRLNRLRRPPSRRPVGKYAPPLRQGRDELFRALPAFQQVLPLPTPTSFQGGIFRY